MGTAPKRQKKRPKPTDFPLSTSNVISVQSYHTKNYYVITMSSRPISTMYRHTISPICDQRGPTHSPKTAKKTPQTNRFSFVHLQRDSLVCSRITLKTTMLSLCHLDLSQLCIDTLNHPSVTKGDPLTAPKRPKKRPKPTDFPLSTSNVISVQSYHTKNYYAITMSSRPISTMYRHTKSPICDQRGPPHSPKTAKKTPQTNRFSFVHLQRD